jgi:hypothetical protein
MNSDVRAYLEKVASPKHRRDAETLVALTRHATGEQPRMWGTVVGFGQYHYQYTSGREGDAPAAGFAARKAARTVYVSDGAGAHADLVKELGPHTTGVGCIYKDLDHVDLDVLETVIARSYATLTAGTHRSRARDSR